MAHTSRAPSLLRKLRRLTWLGISSLSTWLRQRRTSRPATPVAFYPNLDQFEGRFYPGSILAWSSPAWVGAAYVVDRALTAPRSADEVYWDEARAATSVQAGANASPWSLPSIPEASRAAALERPPDRPFGPSPAPTSEADRSENRFSFAALNDLDEGLADPWAQDLFAGFVGPNRPAARTPAPLRTEQGLPENAASAMGMLGGGSVAAPPSADTMQASTPVPASAAAPTQDEALLSALAGLAVLPAPATAPATTAVGALSGSGGSGSNNPPPPPSSPRSHHGVAHGRGPQHGKDPLWVIDVKKGVVANANATTGFTLHDFSTWPVHLIAQVAGATANSYSWSLPADAQGATITNGYDLTFTWATFTMGMAGPRSETVVATANTSAGTQTLTLNYLVAGTDSPAYSDPVDSGVSWPQVITPDTLNDREATAGGGPYYQLSLATGEVQTAHEFPSYNPGVDPLDLVYSSTAAHLQPIFIDQYQLPSTNIPATVKATLSLNGTAYATPARYSTAGFNPGDIMEIALQTDASSLPTGRYPYTISLTDGNNTPLLTQSGSVDLVNEAASAFGAGWSLDNEERLWPVAGQGAMLELPGGRSLWFALVSNSYMAPAGEFSTFSYNSSTDVYTDTLPDGTQYNFSGAGLNADGSRWLTSVVDRTGTALTYGYTTSPNNPRQLVSLTDFNHQTTTLTYVNGELATITDPAGRTATLSHDGNGNLTSIEDFDSAVWTYAYDGADHLTGLTDPREIPLGISYTTIFGYDTTSGRATNVTWPDGVTEYLGPVQLVGLGESGATPTAALVVQALATFSDGDGNTWEDYLDWHGFGSITEEQVPAPFTYTYLTYRDAKDLPWLTADPAADRYRYTFDGNGNPTKIVYPTNAVATYSYNTTFSEVTSFTDRNGKQTQYGYDGSGNLLSVTDALSHVTSYTYTLHGYVASAEDANGHITSFGYDGYFRLQTVTEPYVAAAGKSYTLNYGYDTAGDLTTEKDARGNTVTMTYDAMGRMLTEEFPDVSPATYTYSYDGAGNLSFIEDPLAHFTDYSFDQENRLFSITDALGDEFSWEHDGIGNVVTEQDALPDPRVLTFIHDGIGNTVAKVKTSKVVLSMIYDAASRMTMYVRPLTHTFRGGFNSTQSYSYAVTVGYLFGDPHSYDFLIATDSFTWTPDDQLASETDPMGENVSYQYDNCDCLSDVSDNGISPGNGPSARVTSYGRDALHRITSITDPLSDTTSFGYDPVGNQTTVTDALGHVTSDGYDELNRLTSVTVSPAPGVNLTTTYGYDENGNQVFVKDPLGHIVTYAFDARNRLTSIQQSPDGTTLETTTIGYDAASRETSVQDPDGNATTYGYDNADRLTSETTVFGARTYTYNNDGELMQYQDRDGRVLSFSYDGDGNVIQEQWYNGATLQYTATYTYDDADRLLTAQDPYSDYALGYDLADKLTSVDNQGTPNLPDVVLNYGYDNFSMPANLTDNLGGTLSYTFDAADRLTYESLAVNGTQGPQVTLGYDAANRLTGIQRKQSSTGPSITSAYGYDNADRLTSIVHTSSAVGQLSAFTYAYDAASRVTTYTSSLPNSLSENLHYTYDHTNQLLGVSGTHTENYGYDLNGNRTMSGYATTYQNRMTQAVEANGVTYNYTYDNEGNMLTKVGTEGGQLTTYSFAWDYHNRLTSVTVQRGGTTAYAVTYTYDVFDRRIGQVIQNGSQSSQIWTVYNGANPYADFDGSGNLTNRYLYADGMDSLLAKDSAGNTVSWYLEDGLGSVRQVVQTDGVTGLDNLTYDSFGNVLTESNAAGGDRFKFTAREYDPNTGLQYNRARYYDPGAGRWISEDPIGFGGHDTNLYRYVANNPIEYGDPTGLDSWLDALYDGLVGTGLTFDARPGMRDIARKELGIPSPPPPPIDWGEVFYGTANGLGIPILRVRNLVDPPPPPTWDDVLKELVREIPSLIVLFGLGIATETPSSEAPRGMPETPSLGREAPRSVPEIPTPEAPQARVAPRSEPPSGPKSTPKSVCFPADTLVATQDGAKAIQTIRQSDLVWSYDLVAGRWELRQVVETYEHDYEGDLVALTIEGEVIEATGNHPFWVVEGEALEKRERPGHVPPASSGIRMPGCWVDAGSLRVGDVLQLKSERWARISRLSVRQVRQMVFNFQVEKVHTYAVGKAQVLVHNKPPIEDTPGGPTPENPPPYFQGRHLNPDFLENELPLDCFEERGLPEDWTFVSRKGGGPADLSDYSEPGAQKVYEVWRDGNGNLFEVHYDLNPDGSVSHVKTSPYSPRSRK